MNKYYNLKFVVLITVMALTVTFAPTGSFIKETMSKLNTKDVLLIDPGHGGFDGGAQSAKGVPEKDINLSIAKSIAKKAERDGWVVIMTREEDVSLDESEGGSIRSRKTKDLNARLRIINESHAKYVVSIHLNSFTQDKSVHGAQVFFSDDSDSKEAVEIGKALAEKISENLKEGLNDGTDRAVLAKKDVKIMKNVKAPTVIVECGFLSNDKDATLLANKKYQEKLAQCIYYGIMEFSGKNIKKNIKVIDSGGCS